MKEELISFKTAKLAKEKEFDIHVPRYYISNGSLRVNFEDSYGDEREYRFDPDDFDKDWNIKGWVVSKNGEMCFGCKLDNIKYFTAYSAPTQSLLQKWIREVHNIHISVYHFWDFTNNTEDYQAQISQIDNEVLHTDFHGTYELALEEGLNQALKLI